MNSEPANRFARICYPILAGSLFFLPGTLAAYPKYQSADGAGDYCADCHGDFRDGGYISNKDGTPWNESLMGGHLNFIGDCQACHQSNVNGGLWLNASDSAATPKSCVGCHGRDADVNDNCTGLSQALDGLEVECGSGAGLRKHHTMSPNFDGDCAGCHSGDPDPVGEDVDPFNYAVAGIDINDACDADGTESQFGPTGLDNDGDLLTDGADPDCAPPVDTDGDGVNDSTDNCTEVANADQRDTDGDQIGNICDPDVAQPNDCSVNFADLNVFKTNFFAPGDLVTDLNGDGSTNFGDLNIVKTFFFGPPGPSAAGCN